MSASIKSLIDLTKARRTIYELKPELPTGVTEQEITALASAIIKHTPTSFNIQNIRAIVLYGDANKKLWSSVYEATKEFPFSGRPKSLAETSYGTIVFFNDQTTIDEISKKFEVYKDNFPIWAANANGAAQIDIWKAISAMGLGANLQHFNPWVQESVKDKVDGSWNVVAQLAFGVPAGEAGEKQFADYEIKEFR
ncbi:putative nitroreductase [Saccharomycopsis crataegensis]|uniref:Nitroreductase n=1 Tax=Saccharomycopsis crataegensis TaxID=43959 RepID=A0AAV5QKS9_9ASCO|nr:putative nitroreductase [Saccharomycopsis crataegensis]